jgi:glycosyltransferase involved in cell wall biosynthesis
MRKITFIATNEWVPWGGSELCWATAAEKLARRGIEVRVSTKRWDKRVKEIEHLRSTGCRIFYRNPLPLITRVARKIFPLPDYAQKYARSVSDGVDLVVISQSSFHESLQWIEAVRGAGAQYAIIVQGASETLWPPDETLERLSLGFDNAVRSYFVSEANLSLFRRQLGIPLRSARVIRNPFNVRYDARPPWPGDPSNQLSLACVARLDIIQKGQDLLVEVLGLPHWRNRNVRVVLAGNGPNEKSLRRMVEMCKLPNVEFAGVVQDIERLWAQHHALLLPSRFEGMPLALVEGMLCGRPAIVTDVAGHRELIRDGVNGFLVKAPTIELLDETMNRVWENRSRLQKMGEKAAIDIRQWVSADPVEDFVRDLTTIVDNANSSRA